MYGAHIAGDLSLDGAKLLGKNSALYINTADIKGAAFFQNFSCDGPVTMLETRIDHQVLATGAKFGSTVSISGSSIDGDLTFRKINSSRTFDLRGTSVGGSIYLDGAYLGDKEASLSMRNTKIAGDVFLMTAFHASGPVNMWQAEIKRGLWVSEAELTVLDCMDVQIGGDLTWIGILHPEKTTLKLLRASVRSLRDVKSSWPSFGNLQVGGFVYQQIALEVPPDVGDLEGKTKWKGGGTSPDDRIAWLKLQSKTDQIASQPWLQLAQFVQARGNPDGAREVLYDMERIQAWSEGPVTYVKSSLYEFIEEDPWRVLYLIVLFWIFGSVIFWRARRMNLKAMAPKEDKAYDHFSKHDVPPPNIVPFNPLVYALENILPVVKFGQDDTWGPNPHLDSPSVEGLRRWLPRLSYSWLAFVRLLLIVLGWALALILAGVIGSLFKS
jgi:hypothetical protein